MKIAVDYDGTCVTHDYPKIGRDVGAIPVLKRLVSKGHTLTLFTMRSGKELEEAVDWFRSYDIPLHGINKDPGQEAWTQSPKAYAQLYIDDAALGIPLSHYNHSRPYVNWEEVELMLERMGVL